MKMAKVPIMKRFFLLVALTFVSAIPAYADALTEARDALELFSPISINKKGANLIVVLPQRKITNTIYEAVMLFGLCARVQTQGYSLQNIKEVTILNQHKAQGYVFEGGAKECRELGESDNAKIKLLGRTHLY